MHGHLFAAFLERSDISFPFVGLVVSGGHTSIYHVKGPYEIDLVGKTRDDAAGEAFDKVAKLLGLGYPGGPVIDKEARGVESGKCAFSPGPHGKQGTGLLILRSQDSGAKTSGRGRSASQDDLVFRGVFIL